MKGLYAALIFAAALAVIILWLRLDTSLEPIEREPVKEGEHR